MGARNGRGGNADNLAVNRREVASWAEVQSLLRPVLRPTGYRAGASGAGLLRRQVFPFVDELVVIDLPDARAFVDSNLVRRWGVPPGGVFAVARANLAASSASVGAEPAPSLRIVDNSGYASSLPLLAEWLSGMSYRGRRAVAFVPDPDTLLIVADEPGLLDEAFATAAEHYDRAANPLSPQGYTTDEHGRVVPFDHAGPHPSLPAAIRARCTLAVSAYAPQTALLRGALDEYLEYGTGFEAYGIEPAFAPEVLLVDRGRGPLTLTTWVEQEADVLLPRTDCISFVRFAEDNTVLGDFVVPSEVVVNLLGLRPAPGIRPERLVIREWPSRSVYAAIRAAAVVI
ncbi:hypothetical protein GFY24_21870 [Nocardia sp. SYP-A9097]|uniref:hypothetical protein n=1 Tax=Nocardia sp. SYP-A9097 TaxID=2663237 RepID=UPI001322478E|nr:hypothetical protein [Nocardia sp. SYP-A9097]MRH90055.1 hypothetical protein [Nocardia sp. SYP-A9097]